jgi:hypothetical protein
MCVAVLRAWVVGGGWWGAGRGRESRTSRIIPLVNTNLDVRIRNLDLAMWFPPLVVVLLSDRMHGVVSRGEAGECADGLECLPGEHPQLEGCPTGCVCWINSRGSGLMPVPTSLSTSNLGTKQYGCVAEAKCVDPSATAFPTSAFPAVIDCIAIHLPHLPAPSLADKAALLARLPNTLRRLDLSFNRLGPKLPHNAFSRFAMLCSLNLEFVQLTALRGDEFTGAVGLRTLWLTGNHYEPVIRSCWLCQQLLPPQPPPTRRGAVGGARVLASSTRACTCQSAVARLLCQHNRLLMFVQFSSP